MLEWFYGHRGSRYECVCGKNKYGSDIDIFSSLTKSWISGSLCAVDP